MQTNRIDLNEQTPTRIKSMFLPDHLLFKYIIHLMRMWGNLMILVEENYVQIKFWFIQFCEKHCPGRIELYFLFFVNHKEIFDLLIIQDRSYK